MAVTFTLAEDAAIIEGRAAGLAWVKVGLAIKRNPFDVRHRAYSALGFTPPSKELKTDSVNVRCRARAAKARGEAVPECRTDQCSASTRFVARWPLPAGHAMSWGAICTAAYPLYVRGR